MMSLIEYSKKPGPTSLSEAAKLVALFFIKMYQLMIGPLLMPTCRFYPTCSNYAKEAYETHGAWTASALTIKRICKCHPLGGHGYDPVPIKGKTA